MDRQIRAVSCRVLLGRVLEAAKFFGNPVPRTAAIATALSVCFAVQSLSVVVHASAPPKKQVETPQDEQTSFSAQQLEFFEAKIRPLLVEHCFECHAGENREGELSLDSRAGLMQGGSTGPAIVPGKPEESLLIEAINYEGAYEMPPSNKLKKADIKLLTEWVAQGAAWPEATAEHSKAGNSAFDLSTRRAEHWCWQAIQRPTTSPTASTLPSTSDSIDLWIDHYRSQQQLSSAPPAHQLERLRRVYFDLIGLPPPLEVVEQVIADGSDEQYERIVDQLLKSPQFGERWARHWMDLTRYAETFGHEFDYPIEDAYHYRDYLIRAFNADVPYNQFVLEHIAGDVLPTPRLNPEQQFNESIIGTGFWYFHEATHGPVDVRGDEAGHIDNRIDVLGKTFLGLTISCARCHDHKFDAIATEDFYALAGFLQSSRKQRAMLDPHGRIAHSFEQAKQLTQELQLAWRGWEQSLVQTDRKSISHSLAQTIEFLRTNPRPVIPAALTIQGESMTWTNPSSGKVLKQRIAPQPGFAWQGDEQLWWYDGKAGEALELKFEIPAGGRHQIGLNLTKAPDYGITKITWNGHTLGEPIDAYAAKLTTTGNLVLGELDLTAGPQTLRLEIVGTHPQAIARYMVGLDYVTLQRVDPGPSREQWQQTLAEFATSNKLSVDVLGSWIHWLLDQPREANLPSLSIIHQLVDQPQTPASELILAWLQKGNIESQTSAQSERKTWRNDSKRRLFEDFSDGADNWFFTGSAAGFIASGQRQLAPDGKVLIGPVVSTRTSGDGYYGVIRSPTFEITHPQIHYRLRGRNAQLRVIIDGYHLDTYNALLFEGMTITIPDSEQNQWVTQGNDLRNFLGHRAHLEIIDHGQGFVDISEIWFGETAPPDVPNNSRIAADLQQALPQNPELTQSIPTFVDAFVTRALDIASKTSSAESTTDDDDNLGLTEKLLAAPWANLENDSTPTELQAKFGFEPFVPAQSPHQSNGEGLISTLSEHASSLAVADRELKGVLERALKHGRQAPAPIFVMGMTEGTPENEYLFVRGNHQVLGSMVPRRNLSALSASVAADSTWNEIRGSGRLELANDWVSPNNPLVSRVIVNRLWSHMFGRGLVESVDNFGVLGGKPSHPELLDQLALDFMDDGWSLKRMLRRMVLTQTYQLSSIPDSSAVNKDPDNRLLHCHSVKRLEGEAIRDAILATSGQLDLTQFGPSVPIHLTPFMQGRGRPGQNGPLDGNGRRSVYVEVRRNFLHPMFLAFDTPIPFNTVGRRNVSNVPAQALILMNDPFVIEQSEKWSEQMLSTILDPEQRLAKMFLIALGRPIETAESQECREFLQQQAVAHGQPADEWSTSKLAWRDMAHIIFNLKSFTFVQ